MLGSLQQTMSEATQQDDGSSNFLILDAIHSASASFSRVNGIINQQPELPLEQRVAEITDYIKHLFSKSDAKQVQSSSAVSPQ